MPAPKVISSTGAAPSADEIAAAGRVAASYSMEMGRGFVKIVRVTDAPTGVIVEYDAQNNIARTTGGVTDYVAVSMPNPVPYRGVSIGIVDTSGANNFGVSYVLASDAQVLASENWLNNHGSPNRYQYVPLFTQWNGGENVWMFDQDATNQTNVFNHKLIFTVPEDCIYPAPAPSPPAYNMYDASSQTSNWNFDWLAGIAAFNARRTAWFKKNSDEFVSALKTGFAPNAPGVTRAELKTGALPASWDYKIKEGVDNAYPRISLADGSRAGRHTKMPIIMSVTYADSVLSDTSANLTQAGTKVTQRAATFQYVDVNAVVWTETVNGTLTQTIPIRSDTATPHYNTYANWYSQYFPFPEGNDVLHRPIDYPFVQDQLGDYGLGTLWNGLEIAPKVSGGFQNLKDSTYGNPTSAIEVLLTFPNNDWPAYSNTLVGTAAPLYLQYHNEVKPQYVKDTTQSSTVMNNSAMYGVTEVHLTPVGLVADGAGFAAAGESVGIFSSGIEDGTQVEIYGTAIYGFNWQTGALTFKSWKPLYDANGVEVMSKTVSLPPGSLWSHSTVNCVITYKGLHWPDIAEYVRKRNADMSSGTYAFSDPVLHTLIQEIKAG